MVPIVSLERWTTVLRLHQQLRFRSLVLEKGLPGCYMSSTRSCPRSARLQFVVAAARLRRGEGIAAFDAALEFAFGCNNFGCNNKVLIERIGMGGDLDPFAAAGDH